MTTRLDILYILIPTVFALGLLYVRLRREWSRQEKLAWGSTLVTLIVAVTVTALATVWAKSYVVLDTAFPLVLAFLCSCIAFWRAYLVRKETEETQEREQLEKVYEREDLFEDKEDSLKLAETARLQFDKLAVPLFTLGVSIVLVLVAWLTYRNFAELTNPDNIALLQDRMNARTSVETLGFSACMMLVSFLLGVFWNGMSHEKGCRYLRPVGQWLIMAGLIYGLNVVLMGIEIFTERNDDFASTKHWDVHAALLILYVFMAFGVQMFFNVVMEFYRPRSKDEESRPLYESRLLGIITEPGGIARNVAYTLDYQFGFKVSDTWFYRFIEKGVLPFTMALLVCLYFLNCLFFVKVDEQGIVTVFGKRTRVEGPGLHVKYPWPIGRVEKYQVEQTRKLELGIVDFEGGAPPMDEGDPEMAADPTGRVILWGKKHAAEETNFLVPAKSEVEEGTETEEEEPVPIINFVASNITIYFKIRTKPDGDNVYPVERYAYNYANPGNVLRGIALEEILTYFASADVMGLISVDNQKAQQTIRKRVDERVKALAEDPKRDLGIEIVYLGISGIHPPVPVAQSFRNVLAATQEKETAIYRAESYKHITVNDAEAQAARLLAEARSYQYERETLAEDEIERFQTMLVNFNKAPEVFKNRKYLEVLERVSESDDLPRYFVASPYAKRVTEVIFKEKRPDLLDLEAEPEE